MAALPVGFLLTLCICSALATDDGPTVDIAGKKIRGLYMDVEKVKISAYLGVPFATATRFAKPTLIETYGGSEEELSAKELSKTCFQTPDGYFPGFLGSEMWNAPTELSEDCLSLNIWAPEDPSGNVIVWIYGGGFFSGSPSLALYNGSVLAAKTKAVVVNINYRVGPFGFFYLGDDTDAPGNVGLLDQQVALQWIQKHIDAFGGKSDKVTLFGESAGGASVTAHLLAPGSHDLFSKIIVNSGTIRNPWATRSSCRMLYFSMETAKGLACFDEYEIEQSNAEEDRCTVKKPAVASIYNCLLEKSTKDIQNISDTMYDHMRPMEWPFGPITRDNTFFKGDVRQKLMDGDYKRDVAAIFGTVKDEGTFWLPYYLYESGFTFDPKGTEQKNSAIIDEKDYKASMKAFEGYFRNNSKALEILEDGFKGEDGKDTRYRDGVAQFLGDYFFSCSLDEFVDHIWTNLTSTYMYYFTVRSSANPWPEWMGVMHGYEIEYEFGYPFINESAYKNLEKDRKVSEHFIGLIKQFVDTGSFDESNWPKYNDEKKTLVIDEDTSKNTIRKDIHKQYCEVISKAKEAAIGETNDN